MKYYFYSSLNFLSIRKLEHCSLCSGGWLTGAGRVRGVCVSAVETTLAGTNVGSSCTGATVGRAGSAEIIPEFWFEGPRDASWMGGRENEKIRDNKEQNKTKTLCACHLSKRQAAVTSVTKQTLFLWSTCAAQYLCRKCWYVAREMANTYGLIYIFAWAFFFFIFCLSTRWH